MVPLSSLSKKRSRIIATVTSAEVTHGSEVVRSVGSGVSSSAVASSSSHVGLIVGLGALLA